MSRMPSLCPVCGRVKLAQDDYCSRLCARDAQGDAAAPRVPEPQPLSEVTNIHGGHKEQAIPSRKCCRPECPCPGTWNGEVGEHCCRSCQQGRACVKPIHMGLPPPGPPPLYFYHKTQPYFELTNFAPGFPIVVEELIWPTVEHYFQAQKFAGQIEVMDMIRLASTASDAFKLARSPELTGVLREDWENIKEEVMMTGLCAKFTQHRELGELLLGTGDRELIEHTVNDDYWGDGGGGGRNRLGVLLMQVRGMLQNQIAEAAAAAACGGVVGRRDIPPPLAACSVV